MDPISLITTLGPLAAQFFGGRKMAQTEADVAAQRKQAAETEYQRLKESMPEYGVGSAWNQYLAMSKQDPAADMQRKIAAEQEASSIGALKAGGAKALLGGLGASQRQAAQTRMGIEAQSTARQQAALGQYAGVQQRAQDLQTEFGQKLGTAEMSLAAGAAQQAQDVQDEMRRSKQLLGVEALSGLLGSSGDIAAAFKGGGEGLKDLASSLGLNRLKDSEREALIASSFGQTGALPTGEKGMITPGSFSHKTNPIDIMQDGAKVGEMTGGEAILNPEQQNKVSKESPYFRKLMREFAMKARK
jgi:hypothetical protein